MKKIFIVLLITVVVVAGLCSCIGPLSGTQLKGSGRIATRMVDLAPFDRIDASRGVDVILVNDGTTQARIEADDNLIDKVIVRTEGGKLTVSIDPGINSVLNSRVKVTVPTEGVLSEVEASSAASVWGSVVVTGPALELDASSAATIDLPANVGECRADASSAATIKTTLHATKCGFEATSSATIEADLDVAACDAEATSGSTIRLAGKAGQFTAKTTSGAKIKASDLTSTTCKAAASSGSSIKVNCTGTLNASASSGASIDYSGSCTVSRETSSGGSVAKN